MDSADREDGLVERETLLAYEAPAPPADMADRVLAGLRTDGAARPRRWRRMRPWIAVAASVGVAAAAVLLWPRGPDRESRGERLAASRESIAIGARAVAVAEAGSQLAWTVVDGAATVEQRSGDVFYRVTPGQPFVVALPGARVRVLGTCFRVEVSDMSEMSSRKKRLVAGTAGAALSAAVLVTVYEGSVRLENAHGQVELAPGEVGKAAGAPPVKTEAAAPARLAAGGANPGRSALQARERELEAALHQAEKKLAEARTPPGGPSIRADKTFATEERDPSWAPALEQQIQERMTRFLGLARGRAAVECRQTCCQIVLESEDMLKVQHDLQSDVGLRHLYDQTESWSLTAGPGSRPSVSFCLPSDNRELRSGQPDRGVEREALLAASRPAIDACMRGAETPMDFETAMGLEASGEIDRLESRSDPAGHPAVPCVEHALVGAARFAPSDRWSLFRIVLHLEPTR